MKYSALIGELTGHSVSHILYRQLADLSDIPDAYEHIRVDVKRIELVECVQAFDTLHFVGLSVTMPYKIEVINLVDEVEASAHEIGAVNTIKLGTRRVGYNTDWEGIMRAVVRGAGPGPYAEITVLGTGGAARAAIYACRRLGGSAIRVLYRKPISNATRDLMTRADRLGVSLHDYSEIRDCVRTSSLIINASSCGMVGNDPLPFGLDVVGDMALDGKVFMDAVFNPLATPLLRHFEANGAIVIDGLWMMIYQGIGALSVWLDHPIQVGESGLSTVHQTLGDYLHHV